MKLKPLGWKRILFFLSRGGLINSDEPRGNRFVATHTYIYREAFCGMDRRRPFSLRRRQRRTEKRNLKSTLDIFDIHREKGATYTHKKRKTKRGEKKRRRIDTSTLRGVVDAGQSLLYAVPRDRFICTGGTWYFMFPLLFFVSFRKKGK